MRESGTEASQDRPGANPYDLDEHVSDCRRQARAVCAEIAPFAMEADEFDHIDPRVVAALRRGGLFEHVVPARSQGGGGEVDPLAICVIREELAGTSAHADSMFALQGIGSYAIHLAGTDDQRATWLPRVASGEILVALGLTEPGAGSDVKAATTEVHRDGSEMHITGVKSMISNAGAAAFYTTFLREGEGFSLFLVPADRPGLTAVNDIEIIAPHVIGTVTYDRVPVTDDDRIGAPGDGFRLILATLAVFRASVAGAATGIADAALREAVRHTSERKQFGRPLAELGPVAQMLADCAADVEASRLLAYQAATRARVNDGSTLEYSSMAKLFATEAAGRVVDRCVQMMGRWGVIRGTRMEQLYREARPMRIYEGSSEVLRLGIARWIRRELSESQ